MRLVAIMLYLSIHLSSESRSRCCDVAHVYLCADYQRMLLSDLWPCLMLQAFV